MANALLTDANALGYITELLSGDVQSPFGRSSHHQVWSEAMMINPLVRGLCGLEVSDGGRRIAFAPQLPPGWSSLVVRNVAGAVDFAVTRRPGSVIVHVAPRREGSGVPGTTLVLAPAFPRDARIQRVTIGGRTVAAAVDVRGDMQFPTVTVPIAAEGADVVFSVSDGTDIERDILAAPAGATSQGLRILRSRADMHGLSLRLEGLGGARYRVWLRTPREVGLLPAGVRALSAAEAQRFDDAARAASCCTALPAALAPVGGTPLEIAFDGTPGSYVRRDLTIPLR
jgi:hypothetical protein